MASQKARRRARRNQSAYYLFESNTTLGWSVARHISLERGEKMVAGGHARHVNDCNGHHIGYQILSEPVSKRDDVPSVISPVVLTAREMDLIAGTKFQYGQSRTARMSEAQRISRVHPFTRKLLPPEDEIERAVAKLRAFTPCHLMAAD